MAQPGHQKGSAWVWWWRVAQHLDASQLALVNAMAHNVDDPSAVHVLQDKLRESQALLLEIFRVKGLLPGAPNGHVQPQPQPPPFAFTGAPPQPPEVPNGAVAPNGAVEVQETDVLPSAADVSPLTADDPPSAADDQSLVADDPPPAADVSPPMIVTDDVAVDPETDPVAETMT
jgi:hypothetical protein